MAVCKWYLLNIRCFLSCVQIFEHFLNTLRPHFCVALCHLAVGAKIALKRGKKNCKPLFRDLHFLCELFRSRIIKFYVIWLKNVVFRLFAHSFRPRPPFNPIFSFSLKTHTLIHSTFGNTPFSIYTSISSLRNGNKKRQPTSSLY